MNANVTLMLHSQRQRNHSGGSARNAIFNTPRLSSRSQCRIFIYGVVQLKSKPLHNRKL